MPPASKKSTHTSELEKAWNDLVEKIGIAGWREAFIEKITWIRHSFQFSLVLISVCCFYYIYRSLETSIKSGYKEDITDFTRVTSLPASNVTICAQVYFNRTFVRESISVSDVLLDKARRHSNLTTDEFYEQLTLFLSFTARPRKFDPVIHALFLRIVRENQDVLDDFSRFYERAVPSCEKMLTKCWFDRVRFNCCENAVQSVDDDGICFLIMLNFDSDNTYPSPRTWRQSHPGPDGGLVVEASLRVSDFPYLDSDAQNGFRVFVGHTPITLLQSPLAAPHGAETFIEIIPSKEVVSRKCAPHGRLAMAAQEADPTMYFDPEGFSCIARKVSSLGRVGLSCDMIIHLERPNRTDVCGPDVNFLAAMFISDSDMYDMAEKAVKAAVNEPMNMLESRVKSLLDQTTHCLTHCQYWTYQSRASFHYLDIPDLDQRLMFSRIRAYYSDLSFRQYEEVRQIPEYLAFCNFGNVLVLYWGMSITGVIHIFIYVPRYWYLAWRRIRDRRRVAAVRQARGVGAVRATVIVRVDRCETAV